MTIAQPVGTFSPITAVRVSDADGSVRPRGAGGAEFDHSRFPRPTSLADTTIEIIAVDERATLDRRFGEVGRAPRGDLRDHLRRCLAGDRTGRRDHRRLPDRPAVDRRPARRRVVHGHRGPDPERIADRCHGLRIVRSRRHRPRRRDARARDAVAGDGLERRPGGARAARVTPTTRRTVTPPTAELVEELPDVAYGRGVGLPDGVLGRARRGVQHRLVGEHRRRLARRARPRRRQRQRVVARADRPHRRR